MNDNNRVAMSISLGGSNYFQVGNLISPYVVNPSGTDVLAGFSEPGLARARYAAIKRIMETGQTNILGSSFADATKAAIDDGEFLNEALKGARTINTQFASGGAGSHLKMVARLISIAPSLGLKRQVFFLNFGGYDSHGAQVVSHPMLLKDLSSAMHAFYTATVELGMENQVTTFTASDFGRTYTPNGDGTDHAWGNLQWVMGGAVAGGDLYGKMPSQEIGGPDDTGRGRWLPSTSVDEYNSTLARWFGVSDTNLPVVLPNIGRFAKRDLGFMA